MNCLTQALADVCGQNLLDEKWLVAPSRRVGQQWLESVTRSGQPVVNARIKTVTSLAIDLAAAQMAVAAIAGRVVAGVSAGTGAGNCVMPAYRVYEH